jgi:hypothetical protein
MLLLLAAAEVAAVPDRAGGESPWAHLVLSARTSADAVPFWNTRFVFLIGAAATSFLAARFRRSFAVLGHVYVVAALGAEVVGLVAGSAASPWRIFIAPASSMGPHLALTGVVLAYGAGLVALGIARASVLTRRIGLGALIGGGLKVVAIDLTALDTLYRVGSLVALGVTFLAGNYAYARFVAPAEGSQEAGETGR